MSEVFMVPDCNSRSNNSNMDSALLMSMMNSAGGFGNGGWLWVIFLFFLEPLMRNGFFGNGNGSFGGFSGLNNTINNDAGRQMLLEAINGNGAAVQNLANMFSTSNDFIKQAICGVENSITQLSGQVGLSGQQVINAIQQGNMGLASQLSSCCCNIRESVTAANYQNQIATLQQTQTLSSDVRNVGDKVVQGFCDTAYATRDQTCQISQAIQGSTQTIKDTTTEQTNAIIAKLDNMERTGLLDKIDAQRETISNLQTNANIAAQNYATQQMIGAAVAPLNAQLAEIRNSQPNTVTVPYTPFQVIPNGLPFGGSGCNCGNNYQNQFWY